METLPIPTPTANHRRHVLLATDLGASSARAADEAIELAAEQAAVLLILNVMAPAGLPHLGRQRGQNPERERRERLARDIVSRATARGVTATSVVWYGDPAEAIIEAAWTERADVVVLGSRKRTNLGRLLLGSVSSEVAGEATCPVVVVPA
jgi:nucleotide-binding universal stress UspA family protein